MYRTYIFDLDGTLLDTLEDLAAATNAALEKFGFPRRTKDEVCAFVGNGVKKLVERALPGGADNPLFDGVFAEFKRYYGEHCLDHTKPYEGITELLKEIKARGGNSAIVSNKSDFAVKKLSADYFGDLVAAAVGENEDAGIRKKPAPDSVLAVLKELGADKSDAVYVGDSDVDVETAKNAGLPCLSVTWGFRSREFLLAHGATALVDRPEKLLAYKIS